MDYIGKKFRILQCFGRNDFNKCVIMIQSKFGIIPKAGMPEFLSKYTKKWCVNTVSI